MQFATLHRFHSTTTSLHLIASLSASWSTWPPIDASRQAPFIQKGSRAWDLTPGARPAFAFINPSSLVSQVSQIDPDPFPGCPESAGTHTDVLILEQLLDLATKQIRTPVCPPCRRLSFGSSSPAYPHIQLVAECLLSTRRRDLQTGGSHLAAASYSHLAKPR